MSGTRGSARRVLVLRCPDWLTGEEPEPAAAARAFEPVVAIMAEFCPQVEVLRPGLAAIAARGPSRYFGGEAVLAARLAEAVSSAGLRGVVPPGRHGGGLRGVVPPGQHGGGLRGVVPPGQHSQRGITCQIGIADGLFAADLAAQAGPGLLIPPGETPQFLAGLPVAALPCADLGVPELGDLLPRLGIRTLGEFAALPAAEAGSRFGAQGIVAHRLARGLDPRPLAPQPPRRDLSVEQAFDPPADQSEPVVFTAKALAERMHARLAAHGLVCVRVQVQVRCADGQEFTRLWRHDGLLSALAVAERVRWQLDGWRGGSGRDPGTGRDPEAGGITLLRLVPDQLVRATGHQLALWGDAVVSDRVARAAIRVQAMLGHTAVTRPVLSGGRSPSEQVLLAPFGDAGLPQRPADRPWPGQIPAPAPAIVYPEPQPASVTDAAGREVSVSGRAQLSASPAWLSAGRGQARAVICWAGPWPVTERWWDPARTRRQARFQLVTDDGSAWLAVLQDGQWQLEAQYG